MGKFTVKDFIEKAEAIHGNSFDYSKVEYVSAHVKVEIVCRVHGSFFQSPANHIHRKAGCRKCMGESFRATNDKRGEFIRRAREVHGEKYSYKKAVYRGALRKLTVGCRTCRIWFEQTAASHLTGRGCKTCAYKTLGGRYGKLTPEEFIRRTSKNAPDLIPNMERFKGYSQKIDVTCTRCDHVFRCGSQRLSEGNACCPVCEGRGHSAIAIQWLEYEAKKRRIQIQHARNKGEFSVPGTKWRVDGFNPRSKTIFEFHGDCYHGNPEVYKATAKCHPFNKDVTAKQLYKRTMAREQALRDLGYNVVSIWESEWRRMRKTI